MLPGQRRSNAIGDLANDAPSRRDDTEHALDQPERQGSSPVSMPRFSSSRITRCAAQAMSRATSSVLGVEFNGPHESRLTCKSVTYDSARRCA
jgi:hypothetical protein